jgi:hypothetical protein
MQTSERGAREDQRPSRWITLAVAILVVVALAVLVIGMRVPGSPSESPIPLIRPMPPPTVCVFTHVGVCS